MIISILSFKLYRRGFLNYNPNASMKEHYLRTHQAKISAEEIRDSIRVTGQR